MSIFRQSFSAGEVIKAADMPMGNLQNWLRRGLVVGHRKAPIQGGGSPGRHRRFTWFTVMEIATVQALTQAGMGELPLAFEAARRVAHSGHGSSPRTPGRIPGFPYQPEFGLTFLAVAGDRSQVVLWKPGEDPMTDIRQALGHPEGFILLDVLAVFDRVCGALGLHPSAVLDQAYSENRD